LRKNSEARLKRKNSAEPELAHEQASGQTTGHTTLGGDSVIGPTYFDIESLDLEGRGVARREDGKVVFIEGALPLERVRAQINVRKAKWEEGVCTHVIKESSSRVKPACAYFGLKRTDCGGCKMQHLSAGAQVAIKQRVLEDNLWHIGKVKPGIIYRAVYGPEWGYRFRARLSVRFVKARDHALVGFHERQSRYIADISSCAVLPLHVSQLLLPLRELIGSLSVRESCPQIEVACGDEIIALVLRHLEPLSEYDKDILRTFSSQHNVQWWLQPGGTETIALMQPNEPSKLAYSLPAYSLRMPYRPSDFTQVNPKINEILVHKALQYLQVNKNERVVDWFCGLGNFTLPLATQAAHVLGVEGSEGLVQRARENLTFNQARLGELAPTHFVSQNLFEMTPEVLWSNGSFDKWLIDPPREGCMALVKSLAQICSLSSIKNQNNQAINLPKHGADSSETSPLSSVVGDAVGADRVDEQEQNWRPPTRIVYVSCNPSTLARDAQILVHEAGYTCSGAGVVNMFAHTAHVESIAVFDWPLK
jgi:23S rRNA (uracil1939-C5)-methyltransferase